MMYCIVKGFVVTSNECCAFNTYWNMSQKTLASVVSKYIEGVTYRTWGKYDGFSEGGLNNIAKGETKRPHPDTLLALAKAFAAEGKGKVEYIYYELMEAAEYLDMLPSQNDEITLDEWREFKKIDPEGALHFLEEHLGPFWNEIVKDVVEIQVSLDKKGHDVRSPVIEHRDSE